MKTVHKPGNRFNLVGSAIHTVTKNLPGGALIAVFGPVLCLGNCRAGQLLAVIRNPDFVQLQQDCPEARGQLTYARAEYEALQACK